MHTPTWIEGLLNLFFPDRCVVCSRSGTLFCTRCCAALRPYPPNEAPPQGLDAVAIAWLYDHSLRTAIHRMKYARTRRMAQPLGTLLAQTLQRLPPADALLPVPLHAERLAERGFNQAEELARQVAQHSGVPLIRTGLVRNRDTGHQASLNRAERRRNISGAFTWQGATAPPARVILVDDVLTTGATLVACADALRAAGSRTVSAIALARSLAPDRHPTAKKGYATIKSSPATGQTDANPTTTQYVAAHGDPVSAATRRSTTCRTPRD